MSVQSKTIFLVATGVAAAVIFFVLANSASESVLGGVSNSLVVGLAAGFLVSVLAWQIGSVVENHRRCRANWLH